MRRTYDILPGLRWTGRIHLMSVSPAGVAVAFDAEDPRADPMERYVFDRAVLSFEQFKAWTGVDLTKTL